MQRSSLRIGVLDEVTPGLIQNVTWTAQPTDDPTALRSVVPLTLAGAGQGTV
jgi:hypothetical protein